MIRMRLGETALLGLTDVNVQRMTAGDPILVSLADLGPPGREPPRDFVIFHATREALLEIAEAKGVDPKMLLDQLGEG